MPTQPDQRKSERGFVAVAESRRWKEAVEAQTAALSGVERMAWFRRRSSVPAIREQVQAAPAELMLREDLSDDGTPKRCASRARRGMKKHADARPEDAIVDRLPTQGGYDFVHFCLVQVDDEDPRAQRKKRASECAVAAPFIISSFSSSRSPSSPRSSAS